MSPSTLVHAHSDWALHVALAGSGSSVLSTGLDGTARLRTPHTSHIVPLPVSALQCGLSERGDFTLALRDGTVRTYSPNGRERVINTHPDFRSTSGAAISANGGVQFDCFTSGVEHAVILRNTKTDSQLCKRGTGRGRGVQISQDGSRVAYIGSRNRATMADSNLRTLFDTTVEDDAGLALNGYARQIVVADSASLRFIDLRDGVVRYMTGYSPPGRYGRCATSWDGDKIVAAERDGFGVWDRSGEKVFKFRNDSRGFQNGCAMSHNGAIVVTADTDGNVRLWSTVRQVGRFVRRRETKGDCRWWNYRRAAMHVT